MGKYKTLVWKPFRRTEYRDAWRKHNIIGVLKEFVRDLRRCHQRIWRGYCDYDIFAIDDWFLGLMPTMLEDFRDHLHGCPVAPDQISHPVFLDNEEKNSKDNELMNEWRGVLNRMIFLLREANEETCKHENQYYDQYCKAEEEFEEKYGRFGKKLLTEEEKKGPGIRWHMMDEIAEYKPIHDLYFDEEKKLEAYRKECKEEAMALFNKWFYDLWD